MNTKQIYTTSPRNLLLFASVLVIVGSFLPWEVEGDFVSTWQYGIQIIPVFADNGGILVLLLGIFIMGLMFRSGGVVKYPTRWLLTPSIILFIISAYHIVDWLVRRVASNGIVGAPAIKIGLIIVGIGSILVLVAAVGISSKEAVSYGQKEARP